MNVGRWLLALMGVLAMGVTTVGSAAANERPRGPVGPQPQAGLQDLGGEDDVAEDESDPADEGDDTGDEGDEGEDTARRAVQGRVPAGIRERIVAARRALQAAERASDRGADRQAAVRVRQGAKLLAGAHDAALKRADKELPGGAAAVRAVTSAQHRAIIHGTDLVAGAGDGLYAPALAALEGVVQDRDEAARFLAETSGAERSAEAIGNEITDELEGLEEVIDDEDTDEDVAGDLTGVAEAIAGTAEALGLDVSLDLGDDEGDETDAPAED